MASAGGSPEAARARHYIESAQLAERGKFDFVFVADVMAIRNFDDRRIAREREHGILKLDRP
jgi:alkanesulfonate monooxygenase SsuD/methylene tetrahydromethanopterin reductase-like flavin-dependent oxidoreductase (luciferase family)